MFSFEYCKFSQDSHLEDHLRETTTFLYFHACIVDVN